MAIQKISRKNLNTLYEAVKNCSTWRGKIEQALINQQLNDEIEVDDSVLKEAYGAADKNQKALLDQFFVIKSPKKVIDLIDDFDDILKLNGQTYNDVVPYKNPLNKNQISQNGLAKIQAISTAYNQGEVLDFNNTSQPKYYIVWKKTSGGWVLYAVYCHDYDSALGSGCYFVSEEAARDAAKKFKKEFIEYLPE